MSLKLKILLPVLLSVIFGFAQNPVKLTDTGSRIILANEFIKATINKKTANIISLQYDGQEMIGKNRSNWNIVGEDDEKVLKKFPQKVVYSVRQDPANNHGERVEVSFKFLYEGDTATIPLDIDLRFTLGRADHGIYLSALWKHRSGFPEFEVGQGRMIIELNPTIFDFYTVDANRRQIMPTAKDVKSGIRMNVKEATLLTSGIHKGEVNHKYDFSTMLAQTPTWGWTSTEKKVGFWMINPSFEYMNGGPTQVGITGHVESILLNHWQDGHYGGESLKIKQNEVWEKYVGPIFLYCNTANGHHEMWKDALNEAKRQRKQWPFAWVNANEYPQKQERGILSGQIVINDPYVPNVKFSNMWVGLAYPFGDDSTKKEINWQFESKHYQFWVRADTNGNFKIPNIRPGQYNLYAFADGILGEYKKLDITIAAGSNIDLGKLMYTPVRYGKQLWEIGIPNRSAVEFRHGDHYWKWGLYMLYPKEFPNDVNYIVGKSDWTKDWNYCQPTVIGADYKVIRGTTWNILFDLPESLNGKGFLRLAICGSRNGEVIKVTLNDIPIGNTGNLPHMGVMHRDGIRGKEVEITLPFDASLLKKGKNSIKLSLNARNWTFGVLYDYIRLEFDQNN
ncbi:MAG TPA: polysaccharide lyase family protein [Paludibacter sp.]